MDFNELMQSYVNLPYEELVSKAQNDLALLAPVFDEASEDGNGSSNLFPIILTCLAVDGKYTVLEYKFLEDVFGRELSYDETKKMVNGFYDESAQDALDKLIDSCSTELKSVLLDLCTCVMAVDETLDVNELKFIQKLIIQ